MSPRKVRQYSSPPFAWKGFWHDITHWRQLGADAVLGAEEVVISGETIDPVWRWFNQERPVWRELVARMFCHCGSSSAVASVARVWQPGRETVVVVHYQQRKRRGDGSEMLLFEAVVHRSVEQCNHGPLLLHAEGEVATHCRKHDLVLRGSAAIRAVDEARPGGWEPREVDGKPRPKRVPLR